MASVRKLRGRWQAQVRMKGFRPKALSFDTRSAAVNWARSYEESLRTKQSPYKGITGGQKLRDLMARYVETITPTKRGRADETVRMRAMMRAPICDVDVHELTSGMFASYRDARMREVASATVARELHVFAHVLEVARREWDIQLSDNPVRKIAKPKPPPSRTRRLAVGEEEMIFRAAQKCDNPEMPLIITLALETAMRRGEILSLHWRHIDLERRVAHLPMTKNGHPRDVPLTERAVEALRASPACHLQSKAFITTPDAVRQSWSRLCARAGIHDLHFHDLRHEAITRFFEIGLNVMEVAAISGHRDLRMLQRYTHIRAEDLAKKIAV